MAEPSKSQVELLDRLYTNVDSSSVAFAGADKLFEEARRIDPTLSRLHVWNYLEGQRTYTQHKSRRFRHTRLQTIPKGFYTDFQVDLADFQKLARYNRGFRYIMVGVEVLSRQVFAIPVKSKKSSDMISAFGVLFDKLPALPWAIFSDRGTEFEGSQVREFLAARDIAKHSALNHETKASMAERSIQTVKHRLYRWFTHHKTLTWIDAIDHITRGINNTRNRMTGMRPTDVNFKNATALWSRLYSHWHRPPKEEIKNFKEGDTVRVAREKMVFTKGYLPRFSRLTYNVRAIKPTQPTTYKLTDSRGRQFQKRFYREELARARPGSDLKIERVLRRRKSKTGETEYLIRFEDRGSDEDAWLSEKDVILTE